MKIARNIILLLIVGQLTAAAGDVETKFVVKEAQVEKALKHLASTKRPPRGEPFTPDYEFYCR
jgi:hypothetical protein